MSATIEARFIAAVVKDGSGDRYRETRQLPVDAFADGGCRRAWRALTGAESYDTGVLHPDVARYFAHETTGIDYVADREALFISVLAQRGLSSVNEWLRILPQRSNTEEFRETLQSRRFNFGAPIAEPTPRFFINKKPFSTCGNLTNVSAQAKHGKTAWLAAMIAAAICAEYDITTADTLGVTATAPRSAILTYIDTEQSPFDADQNMRRAHRRAGVTTSPSWLAAYGLAGMAAPDLRAALKFLMADAAGAGGNFAVIIDGTADLVSDVNDPEECNAFVAELHGLAIKHGCPIVNVVHENPGQDGGKMRGHLGSQLERKAESNIRLKKVDDVTVVFSDRMRKAPISEKDGPRFSWSDGAGMHVSVASSGTLREADSLADLRELSEEVFEGKSLRYAEACQKIETARRVGEKAGQKWFTSMKKAGVIQNVGLGYWQLKAA